MDLLGRESELAALDQVVSAARDQGAVLMMVGDPGIGKSALLASVQTLAAEAGFDILTAVGAEAETHLPFGALQQILDPLIDRSDNLPRRQREALETALGRFDGPPPDIFLIAEATLSLLAAAARDRPRLVIADDVQWFDSQSDQILTFLAHRSTNPGIGIIAAARTGHEGSFIGAKFPEMLIEGVDEVASMAILGKHSRDLSQADLLRIRREAQGNPLALLELPAVWGDGVAADDHPPTLSVRLERAFGCRIADLPEITKDALLVAAIASLSDVSEILAAAARLHPDTCERDPLAPAISAELICVEGSHVKFRHPLVRSGVLQRETVARRQAAHQALAEVVSVGDPLRRTWHRSQSIVGPDDVVADELVSTAPEALRRGAIMTAVSVLERAAQLTSSSELRGQRYLEAAENAFAVGRPDVVARLTEKAAATNLVDLDRARIAWLNEVLNDDLRADPTRVLTLCDHARLSVEAGDTSLALNLLSAAALRCWWADSGADAQAQVVKVLDEMVSAYDDPRHLSAIAIAEPVRRAQQVTDRLRLVDVDAVSDAVALRTYGMAAYAVGDFVLATDLLDRAALMFREDGRLGLLTMVLALQLHIRLDLGDWSAAAEAGEEVTRVSVETGQSVFAFNNVIDDARSLATSGDWQLALDLLAPVETKAAQLSLNDQLCLAYQARGTALLCAGRHEEAFKVLKRPFDRSDPSHHLRESFAGIAFLAEAAVASGRTEEARAIINDLDEVARITPAPMLQINLLYARAVLAPEEVAEQDFTAALEYDLSRWPWLRARIDLEYGSLLVRSGLFDRASCHFRNALTVFQRLGAVRWIAKAQTGLVESYYAFRSTNSMLDATR